MKHVNTMDIHVHTLKDMKEQNVIWFKVITVSYI
jgi:hypothetical protein